MRRPLRIAFVVVLVGSAVACGLDVLGSGPADDGGDGGGAEAGTIDQRTPDARDEGSVVDLDSGVDGDAPFDLDAEQQKCLGVCEAGTCDAGTCTIDCSGASLCLGERIVCPPGVACDVRCIGTSACTGGVDCTASKACNVVCNGSTACANGDIACTGSRCGVTCLGSGSCASGIVCDAGRCDLACRGSAACANDPVVCTSDICNVRCGDGGDDGRQVCAAGVTCEARYACNVDCISRESCTNGDVTARAADASTVRCVRDSCRSGINVTAADASITCEQQNACTNQPIRCDGGNCVASCNSNDNPSFCCTGPTTCKKVESGGCNFSTNGCP